MKKFLIFTAFMGSFCVFGCATSRQKKVSSTPAREVSTRHIAEKEEQRRLQEQAVQDSRDREKLLHRKTQMTGLPLKVSARRSTPVLEVQPALEKPISDENLTAELYEHYQKNDEIGFHSRLQMFVRQYPRSSHMDEVLYMAGMMAVSNKDYGTGLKYFNQVLSRFPYSAKTSAALFAKGAVLHKMNLNPLAKDVFERVVRSYPGSPQALRAQAELRILDR